MDDDFSVTFDDDEQPSPEKTEVIGPDKSIRMLEVDSYDRLLHGLRTAAESARHIATRGDDRWTTLANVLDKARGAMVHEAGIYRAGDNEPTRPPRNLDGSQAVGPAYHRVYRGLEEASQACRQIATGHRMDLQWTKWASQLEDLRDKASVTIRTRSQREFGLHLH